MSQALPWAFGYYGGSVAMRVFPFRRSRIYHCSTLVCLGLPFASLNPLIGSRSPKRAFHQGLGLWSLSACCSRTCVIRCRRFRYAAAGRSLYRWKLGFSQCRLSLYPFSGLRAHRTCGTSRDIPWRLAAFLTCYFPCLVSRSGRLGVLEGDLLSTFCFSKSYSTIADAAHPFVTLFVTFLGRYLW